MTTRWIALCSFLILLVLAAASPLTAHPNTSAPTAIAADPPTLVKHLRTELKSGDEVRQDMALIDIISLANCETSCLLRLHSAQKKTLQITNESEMGAAVDLDMLIPDIVKVYRSDEVDGTRLLALSALINIGNERALQSLIERPTDGSKQVERSTHKSVASFFLDRYPELLEKTRRTGRLSLVDVERVRAIRIKEARRAAKGQS
jgi:hypothetical protein